MEVIELKVLYSPILDTNDNEILYEFIGDKIVATYNGEVDEFDFTDMPDGKAESFGRSPSIISTLPICPVIEAVRENGVLSVKLMKFIGEDASEEDKFPSWIEV